ncbi:MAG TPA: chemotaxis response regulator protein-glutamate methylesterase [Candidatus Tectomicrobia bacterium]|nr:chemotaxis response regulator protein-glutamate methylesterase [Candidatus Tectomicrobia bacterium]
MRIALVNDMLLAVEALRRVVTSVPDYDIAWVARNGAEAVAKCAADTPDVILMDLIMPVMDGVEATRRIMAATPCLILVVTATVGGNAAKVFEAMGHGARDAVNTPVLGGNGRVEGGATLLAKIATLGKLLDTKPHQEVRRRVIPTAPALTSDLPPLVALGASTGGPAALAHILSRLPAGFPASFVIIQHVDVQFAAGLADWLQAQTSLKVRLVQDGCRLEVGTVWLAGTNDHMILTPQHALNYVAEPRDYPYRPSVDVFFKSLVKNGPKPWPAKAAAVLLTGMGRDGAEGLAVLRRAGWYTMAQDQASSVVYGMPKAAAEAGAAMQIVSLETMASALLQFFGEKTPQDSAIRGR